MLKRLPVIATLVVLTAVAVMIRLGFWQIERMHQKDALLERLATNPSLPELAFPAVEGDELHLFRSASLQCDTPAVHSIEGAGKLGSRTIVKCSNGALVQLGTALDPATKINWRGGIAKGRIGQAPDHRSLLQSAFDPKPIQLMLVADPPLAGLQANARPDPNDIPNNHWSYAIQWFLFAGIALLIYGLAVRKRLAAKDAEG